MTETLQEMRCRHRRELAAYSQRATLTRGHVARQIIAEIADEHGIRFVDLTGPRRFKALIGPRFTAYFELYQAGYSLKQIGGYFRDRDHTTILHGIRRYEGATQ